MRVGVLGGLGGMDAWGSGGMECRRWERRI